MTSKGVLQLSVFLGRQLFSKRFALNALDLVTFANNFNNSNDVVRVPGTAIFLSPCLNNVPNELLYSLEHFKTLHERVVFIQVDVLGVPRVKSDERVLIETLPNNFWRVKVTFGFMDELNLPRALEQCAKHGLTIDMSRTSFFIGRATLFARERSEMPFWREKLFIAMFRNSNGAGNFFKLPANRVVELGTQVILYIFAY